ncbi:MULTISPECIES: ABC transporter ATP-binding protein [unclassified Paenibacillus]|uniref:ABC transporter ATP-binding protein n=1 Tax=unclassified Paenibacillus TaxID=185978 RepID=UPI000954A615|nr:MULTISPECIES: ABC transporter ATP-binding protein [unclassified Paenibacillus]ASS67708.1 ABC transporter ATP-binding protein [Paenibacillus sp. RUD330]SIR67157.1 ABC-2 type transport system ATP-binding protein [Paenibacillus sp. RU4X]SIR74975.1 ABC-2 type transport system ATP-binding protein [Paenibacillus sp. RU4T]
MNAVELKGLTKSYGGQHALDGITLRMEENRIYGLLGRNGAGKTTLMHVLTAQLFATSGEVKVFGSHPFENEEMLRKICFIKESQKYPENFHVHDVLAVASSLYPRWSQETAEQLLKEFRLPVKKRVKKLSRGMLSAVGIIVGLASRAELTLFDEPYLGLDAVAREIFYRNLIQEYAELPRTIVLSSHLIDEVSGLLEHIYLIDRGRLILDEEAELLRSRAYSVAGPAAKVDAFLRGRSVLGKELLGGFLRASVLGELGDGGMAAARTAGLEAAPLTLQQLVVQMTVNESGNEEGSA